MIGPYLKAYEPTERELGFRILPEGPELLRGNTRHLLCLWCVMFYGEKKSHIHSRPRQVTLLHETKSWVIEYNRFPL